MRKTILLVFAYFTVACSFSQVIYEEIASSRLNADRKLKIKLPQDYDVNSDVKYPVIIVFDGDYLFEPVAGQVDFQTYFDDMPSSIVVGVMQGEDRFYDAYFDPTTGLPTESGLRFHEFVAEELLPHIDKTYNTSKFRVAVGHDLMGNFINSYIFKEKVAFQAYVCISPDFIGSLRNFVDKRLATSEDDIFYYLATSEKDVPHIRENIISIHQLIESVENQKLTYYFDDFRNETHYTLVSSAISRSFDKIFDIYNPIREKELDEKVFPYEGTLDNYLIERYDRIEKLFGITQEISEEEIQKVADIAELREDFESLYKLGKLANKIHPKSLLGSYYLAQSAEHLGKIKKAKKLYESALELDETNAIDKDYIATKIEELTAALVEVDDEEIEELKEEEGNEDK